MKLKMKAFQGANGWYIAEVDADGYHHQPSNGSDMYRSEAAAWAVYTEQDASLTAHRPGQNYKDR